MTPSNDPFKTQPLAPITTTLTRPVQLPLVAIVALIVAPTLVLGGLLLLWLLPEQSTTATKAALLPSPTLGVPRTASTSQGLPRAVIAYDEPGGHPLGALEQGRGYRVVARSGIEWVQIDVALPGEVTNLVWIAAGDAPELSPVASLADLATPVPTATPEVVYIAVPGPAVPAEPPAVPAPPAALAPLLPESTPAYLIPPPTPAPRSVVVVPFPTATPCRIRDLGLSLLPCNGVVP